MKKHEKWEKNSNAGSSPLDSLVLEQARDVNTKAKRQRNSGGLSKNVLGQFHIVWIFWGIGSKQSDKSTKMKSGFWVFSSSEEGKSSSCLICFISSKEGKSSSCLICTPHVIIPSDGISQNTLSQSPNF